LDALYEKLEKLEKLEKIMAGVRAKVEHPF
jgi:hypothetical protein